VGRYFSDWIFAMSRKKRFKKDKTHRGRGIYALPNILTSFNLFFGFYATVAAINQKFVAAAAAILIGVVFDILDGKVARATKTTSKFGVEYDSLADLMTFGLASGLMLYPWVLKPLAQFGWLGAFLFLACGALRLARFNAQGQNSAPHFTGLPIPAAAGMSASTVLFFSKIGFTPSPVAILILLYFLSFLMVSTLPFKSFKHVELFHRMKFNVLVAAVLMMIFIAAMPSIALFMIGAAYILSSLIQAFRLHLKRGSELSETLAETEEKALPAQQK